MTRHPREVSRVLVLALALNLLISALKLVYGFSTSTLSMVADGFHSIADAASSVLGLIAVNYAAKPSDEDHHYGHFKFETMAALGIAIFIGVTGWEVLKSAVHRLWSGGQSTFEVYGIPVMLVGMAINLFLSRYELRKARQYKSAILEADGYHTASDLWVSLSVILSMLCIRFGIPWADPVVSILISLYFAYVSWTVLKDTVMTLSDAAYIDTERVKRIIQSTPGVIGHHHVRTRGKPGQAFLDLHIQVDPKTDTYTSHKLAHAIEDKIKKEITGIHDVLIHTEPYPDLDDDR